METVKEYQAAQFRVALLLKKYKFGAVSAAKYLGKPRGLVQSWMQIGNKHYLAKEKISVKRFEKILKGLRRKVTKENLNYFYAKRLLALNLPVAFISNILSLPTSTVRSWKYGKLPVEIKKFFYDRKLIDKKFDRLLKSLKSDITSHNLEYFLSLELAEAGNMNNGRRHIGGRIISQILTNHFGYIEAIPEKTISCWIDKKRKPWDAFKIFTDTRMVQKEFNKIVDKLTYQHITYHISKKLADQYNWKYSYISKLLGVNKEIARGWIKKGRGNPVAKTFVNDVIVQTELEKYVNLEELERIPEDRLQEEKTVIEQKEIRAHEQMKPKLETNQPKSEDLDSALERELIYHLKTIPTGVSSAKVLQSILIQCSDASLEDIEKVLQHSKHIVKNHANGKWLLKRYLQMDDEEPSIDDELAKIDCETGSDDEVIC